MSIVELKLNVVWQYVILATTKKNDGHHLLMVRRDATVVSCDVVSLIHPNFRCARPPTNLPQEAFTLCYLLQPNLVVMDQE